MGGTLVFFSIHSVACGHRLHFSSAVARPNLISAERMARADEAPEAPEAGDLQDFQVGIQFHRPKPLRGVHEHAAVFEEVAFQFVELLGSALLHVVRQRRAGDLAPESG